MAGCHSNRIRKSTKKIWTNSMSSLALINEFLGQPPNASEHGYQIDHILEFAHWFMGALFFGWSAFFCFCADPIPPEPPTEGRSCRCSQRNFHPPRIFGRFDRGGAADRVRHSTL